MSEEIFDQSGEENKPEEVKEEVIETPESETPAEPEQTAEPISEEKPE